MSFLAFMEFDWLDSVKSTPVSSLEAQKHFDAQFARILRFFGGNDGVNGFPTVNRIAGLQKIKQTVFFNFPPVGWANQTQHSREARCRFDFRLGRGVDGFFRSAHSKFEEGG